MIIAQWLNTDKTRGARLWNNGVLEVMERENSGCVWSPPNTMSLSSATLDFASELPKMGESGWSIIEQKLVRNDDS